MVDVELGLHDVVDVLGDNSCMGDYACGLRVIKNKLELRLELNGAFTAKVSSMGALSGAIGLHR